MMRIRRAAFFGPCPLDENITHRIQLGYFLPLIKHYVEGNIPALDFLTRQYESFQPIGVPIANPCVVVTNEYRNGSSIGNFVIDDYQTQPATNTSSSGGTVTFNVENLTENRLDDNNSDFVFVAGDPFNGATQGSSTDTTKGVVFDWTNTDRFYDSGKSLRAGTIFRIPFSLVSRRSRNTAPEHDGRSRRSDVFGHDSRWWRRNQHDQYRRYGGGLEEPYQRDGGWHNEMETIRYPHH